MTATVIPAMALMDAIFTSIAGAWLSTLVRAISAVALLSKSSATVSLSVPSCESLSQELTVLELPPFGVKLSVTLQFSV